MDIHLLGTGNAFADGGRHPMAILLESSTGGLLLDAGPSTLALLKQHDRGSDAIDAIVLSHHHGDHFAGVPFLILDAFSSGRTKALAIVGPPKTERVVRSALALFYPSLGEPEFALEFSELAPGEVWVSDTASRLGCRVDSIEAQHFSGGIALSPIVEWEGKRIIYSGDTRLSDALIETTRDADLLICECSSYEQTPHQHVSHRELAGASRRILAKRTVLVHPDLSVIEARDPLRYELAVDGQRLTL